MTVVQPQLGLPRWADLDRWTSHQKPIVEEIVARFAEGNKWVLLDMPTGGGKSLVAYMVRQYLNVSGYYIVGTRNLQDQVDRTFDDVPVIKGRANYIPLQFQDADHSWKDPTCADCDKSKVGDMWMCSICDADNCPYDGAKSYAASVNMPCANYAYAFGEWTSGRSPFRNRFVVCDEADTLTNELMKHVSVTISPSMQKQLKLRPPARKTVESAWMEWFDYAVPVVQRHLKAMPKKGLENRRRRQRIERLLGRMENVAADIDGWVYDYGGNNGSIEFKPVFVDKLAKEAIWQYGERFLCMSASLGSPEVFATDHGIDGSWAYVQAPSTFDVERRPFYFFPAARMTHKTKDVEWPKMATALKCVVEDVYPDKKTLVHSHSGQLAEYLHEAICDSGRDVFYYKGSGQQKDDAISAFESVPSSILIAPSLDRGYDNSDIEVGVICKVPFPYLGSKQVEKRVYSTGGQLWLANTTAKTLAQQYGRQMRSEQDSGITLVLDSVFTKFYGDWSRPPKRDINGHEVRQHFLFPSWVCEAVQFDSEFSFVMRKLVRNKEREVL